MEQNKKHGVLFDLDGVLLDSEGQYSVFWSQMDEEYPTGIDNFAAFIKGFHLNRILSYFANDTVREQVVTKLLAFEREMRYEFFPGALDLLRQLRQAGLPMAIVTSSDRKKMEALIRQYPLFPTLVDHIITGDMVANAKPDPECFLKGAQSLGIDIADCAVIEDSRNGLIAGRSAGARVIGVATTLDHDAVLSLSDMAVDEVGRLTAGKILGLLSNTVREQ